jgi:hypothetical protein
MSAISKCEARRLNQIIDTNNEIQAYIYLEQLLLFPADVQDKIIEEISQLPQCNSVAIASIIGNYSAIDL